MCNSNTATEFVPNGLKKQRKITLKSLEILDKMHPEDTNIYAPNIDRYKNGLDNLYDMCLANFTVSYIYEKTKINYEPDDEKSYIKRVIEIHEDDDLKTAITVKLKNSLGKMRKRTQQVAKKNSVRKSIT